MIIFSLKEDPKDVPFTPDESIFLEGNDTLCILVHGLTGTPREMAHLASNLNQKRGYSVRVPLLPCHNQGLSRLKRASWQEIYAGIKKCVLESENRYRTVLVGGLSFGALISLALASEFPERIKALACLSPTMFFDGWGTPKLKILLPPVFRTPLKYYFYFKEESPYGVKNERLRRMIESYYKKAKLDDYSKVHLFGYPVIPVSCMYQNSLLAKYVMSRLPDITTPLLLLQARDDDTTSTKNSQYIYGHVSSPDKEINFLENSYHIITADQERDKVFEYVVNFFGRYAQETVLRQGL